jgi:CHAT domain-containing protein
LSRHGNRWGPLLCWASLFACLLAAGAQNTPSDTAAGASPSAPSPDTHPLAHPPSDNNSAAPRASNNRAGDTGAQIDELIQQSNDAMNVKVQFKRSEELARQALDLSEKTGDKARAAMAMVYLESAISYQGRLSEALEIAQKDVPVARESGDKKALEQALNCLASITGGLGRYEEALGIFYELLDLAREINDSTMQYVSLLNIGEAYVRSDEPDNAELPLQESLGLARKLKPTLRASNPSKKATEMALLNLGGMEMARQHYRAALNYYEQVRESKPESALWVVAALQGMASSYEQLGEAQKAIEFINQAMPIAENAASGAEYRNLLSALGENQEKLGNLDAALASENKALALIHEAGGDPDSEWQVESRIAHIERALGNNDQALQHYRNSIRGIELLRSVALNTEDGRAGILERSRATYAETADVLFEMQREGEALAISERGRARAFLEMLAESRAGLAEELTPEQHNREEAILARISGAQNDLWKEDKLPTAKKKHEAEIAAAENDLEKFHSEVRKSSPHYASFRYPEPVSIQEVQRQLLDENTALIEYLLGERRSLAWVLTKDKITCTVLPERKQIEQQVAAFHSVLSQRVSALTARQSLSEVRAQGSNLYDSIFKPLENALGSTKRLIIISDGTLSYLQFEALVTAQAHERQTYLVEKFAIVYGPSASALVAIQTATQQSRSPKSLLAFGDPVLNAGRGTQQIASLQAATEGSIVRVRGTSPAEDYTERGFSFTRLPYARAEVQTIGELFPPSQRRLYLGADAREETVKNSNLRDFQFIHFASHGFLDESHPARSGILLSRTPDSSEDGILQVGEIVRLKMNADLVTLSACNTGLGKLVNGEGVLGLTRAFFYAGAKNVAVSLWNVNDSATASLMGSFYRNLEHGLPQSEALRQAKLELLHASQPLWRNPYFWAAFVIDGQGQ